MVPLKKEAGSDYSADELELAEFRKLNIEFLDAVDKKYQGKRSSRSERAKPFASDSSDVDISTDDEEYQRSSLFDKSKDSESGDDFRLNNISEDEDQSDEGDSGDEDEDNDNEEDDDDDDDGYVDEESEDEDSNEDNEHDDDSQESSEELYSSQAPLPETDNFNEQFFSKAKSDIEKGEAIKNQLHIWDLLLECRIKFQKCLSTSNQLPKYDLLNEFNSRGGEEFQNLLLQNQKSLKRLLNSFLELQKVTLERNNEFKSPSALKHKLSDDEVTSDDSISDKKQVIKTRKKKMKLCDFSSEIDERHKNFEDFRNKTIQMWNDKTKIGQMGKKNFDAFEQSTLKQIEHVLLDKQRLIKRTQIKRSSYHILGESEDDGSPPAKVAKTDTTVKNEEKIQDHGIYKEIFDDDDFYHQLLTELLKRKASDITDPIQLGKQWIQLQKVRTKMKKTVDTKATKGRKLRYVVHPKLVNFMMPITNPLAVEESRTELLNSLFGNVKK